MTAGDFVPHESPQSLDEVQLRTIGRKGHHAQPVLVLQQEGPQHGGSVTGSIVPHHKAEVLGAHLQQVFEVLLDFLVALAGIQFIQALSPGVFHTPQQVAHLILTGGVDLDLLPCAVPDSSHVWTPVQVRLVVEEQACAVEGNDDDLGEGRDNQPAMVAGQLSLGGKERSSSTRWRLT